MKVAEKEKKEEVATTMTDGIVDLLLNTLENSKNKEDKGLAKKELRKLALMGMVKNTN